MRTAHRESCSPGIGPDSGHRFRAAVAGYHRYSRSMFLPPWEDSILVRISLRRMIYSAALPLLMTAVVACQPGALLGGGTDSAEVPVPAGTLDHVTAAQTLKTLAVGAAADAPGYDRSCSPGRACVFGQAWSDDVEVAGGHNGCDTRNDLLNRDLQPGQVGGVPVPKRFREPGRCVVVEGVLNDPYTGKAIHFTKEHADQVQIDHVVALAAAWRAGAAGWDQHRRQNFANDPANLLVVDGPTNQSKSDATADEWLPPNGAYRCEYARIVVTVKAAYHLTVTPAEQAALQAALGQCAAAPSQTGPPANPPPG
jgi:hypothetical protein